MATLEKVLALRPTNAAARLGALSSLPVLNPRDLLAAREGAAGALVCVAAPVPGLIAALLRAARTEDALIGFSLPVRPGNREAPARFFETVRAAADETGHRKPVFLQAGPLRVTQTDRRTLDQLSSEVHRFVDAGFTLVSLDLSSLETEAAAAAAAELCRAAQERELSIELAPPVLPLTRDAIADYLDLQVELGVRPNLLRLRSSAVRPEPAPGSPEPEPDFELLRELGALAAEHGAKLCIEDRGTPRRLLSTWTAAGVHKLDLGEVFARLVLDALPPDLRAGLEKRTASSGVALPELLAQLDDPLATVPASERERVEARAFGELSSLLSAVGASGAAREAMVWLAEKSGY